jgi:hypothetical protein
MDTDKQERIDAVNRYVNGDKPVNICKEMNRSKKWFFKWLKWFKTGDEDWYRSLSRAPKIHGRQTENAIETAVVSVRKALMEGSEGAV